MTQPETLFIGQKLIELAEVDSTNNYLAKLNSEQKQPEGTAILSHFQTRGRGQMGSGWESTPGANIMTSLLLYPTFLHIKDQFTLSKAVALGVMGFFRTMLPHKKDLIKIKWPNDVYIESNKAAGILIENMVNGISLSHSIIGIGLNINQSKFSEAPNATSLKLETGLTYDLDECFNILCSSIEAVYLKLKSGNAILLEQEYLDNLYRLNEEADYIIKGVQQKATIKGVDEMGRLEVISENDEKLTLDLKEIKYL